MTYFSEGASFLQKRNESWTQIVPSLQVTEATQKCDLMRDINQNHPAKPIPHSWPLTVLCHIYVTMEWRMGLPAGLGIS